MKATNIPQGQKMEAGKPFELFLLLLLTVHSEGSCPRGAHILHYDLTVLSPEKSLQRSLPILIYINDALFLRYAGDSRRADSLRSRIKRYPRSRTWTGETKDLLERVEQLRRMLTEITKQKSQDRGFPVLQATFGCELQGNRSKGFWNLGYNGQDLLIFDQNTLEWKMADPSTQQIRTSWETLAPTADSVKNFFENTCPAQLLRHLTSLPDTGTPIVKVTQKKYPVGRVTLICRAFNLYPPEANLTWLQNGEPAQQQAFGPGIILPSGDGTYQTWVSIWVLPGQEPQFTCHLRHCSHNITVPAGYAAKYIQDAHESVINKDIHEATSSAVAPAVSALSMVVMEVLVLTRA